MKVHTKKLSLIKTVNNVINLKTAINTKPYEGQNMKCQIYIGSVLLFLPYVSGSSIAQNSNVYFISQEKVSYLGSFRHSFSLLVNCKLKTEMAE